VNAVAVVAGCALLAARPALIRLGPPTPILVAVLVVVFGLALTAPERSHARSVPMIPWPQVLALGVVAFAVGRLLDGGHPAMPFTAQYVALNSAAAIAEEALFRRADFAVLVPAGAAFAITGSAVLFALVHLATYGAWVVPLDLAAGLVFGWQRWTTNSWRVPAATHVVANVLVVV
jgi:membrane protease YdiL (CAAX protease family)